MTINLDLLDDESATEAINTVAKIADANGVNWALVGGLALAVYGGDCKSKNIAVIADKLLPLENKGLLRQGGERYLIKTQKKKSRLIGFFAMTNLRSCFKLHLMKPLKSMMSRFSRRNGW